MKCRLIREMQGADGLPKPAGTVIDDPKAFWLVRLGCAEAVDKECADAAGMTPEAFAKAQYGYERLSRGIHPDDFDAYDRGEMVGYNPDGSFIPGPNAVDDTEEEEEECGLWLPDDFDKQ